MKIQELLKGKVLDSDGFKIGGSEVHVIYIADDQKLIDKFKMDVIRPGVPLEFAPTTKESYEGSSVNPQAMDEVGTFSFKIRRNVLNLSMQNVADRTGISKATVSRLEQGKDVLAKTAIKINELYSMLEKKNTMRRKINLPAHLNDIEMLNSYSIWLTKNGYMDTDWKDEEPFAIDSFLKDNK